MRIYRIGMFATAALALFSVVPWPVNAANLQSYWEYGVGKREIYTIQHQKTLEID